MRLKNLVAPAIAAAVVLASTLPSVSAQEQEQRGRRGGEAGQRGEGGRPGGFGGGFGGPGGMMGRGGFGGDMLLVGLLAQPAVREELKLDEAQLAGLEKLAERQRPARPDFDFRNATDAQRQQFAAQMQEQAAKRAAEAKEQLEELLLPEQLERLEQIALQVQGPAALLSPEVAKELELSAETTAALQKDVEASTERTREMMAAAMQNQNFEGIREKAEQMRTELEQKLLAHLTSEQKAKFEEMKGAKFEMPAPTGPFGRGGFGGGQRGQGGPGAGGPEGRGGGRGRGGDRQ
jgi:hypothetical protein